MPDIALLTRPGPRYPIDMFAVCEVMTDESLGSAVDRLAVFNDMMLEMNGEECLDHTYDTFLQVSGAVHTCNTCNTCHPDLQDIATTAWNGPEVSFVFRPWLWQTCTEFGWYQTTNQVRVDTKIYLHIYTRVAGDPVLRLLAATRVFRAVVF